MRVQITRLTALILFALLIAAFSLFYRSQRLVASTQLQPAVVYLPFIPIQPNSPENDFRIVHLGLYQSVQNANNGIPLVAGKPALLRVYGQSLRGDGPSAYTEVTIDAFQNETRIGRITSEPKFIPVQPSASDLTSTFNIDIPPEWLEGQVEFRVTIDPFDSIMEFDETNNTIAQTFNFQSVPPLNLKIVPIVYTDTRLGITYQPEIYDPISDWLRATYPLSEVNVSFHPPFEFSGDLSQPGDWNRLLERLTTLWALEVGFGSPDLYFGLIPTSSPSGSWFQEGIAGLGWNGYRVSIGVDFGDDTAMLAAHEIGHNFGRRHAPCGNPSNVDPNFPYPDGSIGVYGVDTQAPSLIYPNQARDFMSYCGPEWVSDYTYKALLEEQVKQAGRTASRNSGVLFRAVVNGDEVRVLPTYDIVSPFIAPEISGDYKLEVLDSHQEVIGRFPATLLEAEENGVTATQIIAHLPTTLAGGHAYQLVNGDEVLVKGDFNKNTRAGNTLRLKLTVRGDTILLRWNDTRNPALVRFLPKDGSDPFIVAIDQSGGQIAIDPGILPSESGRFEVTMADFGGVTSVELK